MTYTPLTQKQYDNMGEFKPGPCSYTIKEAKQDQTPKGTTTTNMKVLFTDESGNTKMNYVSIYWTDAAIFVPVLMSKSCAPELREQLKTGAIIVHEWIGKSGNCEVVEYIHEKLNGEKVPKLKVTKWLPMSNTLDATGGIPNIIPNDDIPF